MFLFGNDLSIFAIVAGGILVAISATALTIRPENRKKSWPWIVGAVGIVTLVVNSLTFSLGGVFDGVANEATWWAEDLAYRIEDTLSPFQRSINGWTAIAGGLALLIGGVILLRPENRQKKWAWTVAITGLLSLIGNGIWFLVQ